MQKLFRDFFERFTSGNAATAVDERDLQIAAALLMVEIGQADNAWRESEIRTIVARLARLFDIDEEAATALFHEARREDETRVSLHPTIQLSTATFPRSRSSRFSPTAGVSPSPTANWITTRNTRFAASPICSTCPTASSFRQNTGRRRKSPGNDGARTACGVAYALRLSENPHGC